MKKLSTLRNSTRSILLAGLMCGIVGVVHAQAAAGGAACGAATGQAGGGSAGSGGQAGGGMSGGTAGACRWVGNVSSRLRCNNDNGPAAMRSGPLQVSSCNSFN